MKNNDTQHIVKLSPLSAPHALHISAVADIAHYHEVNDLPFTSFAVSRGVFGKVVTILLLPMIFIYPLAPAYAADDEVSATTTTVTTATESTVSTPPEDAPPQEDSFAADLSSAAAGAVLLVSGLFSSGESSTTVEAADSNASSTEPIDTTVATSTATSTDETAGATTTPSDDASSAPVISGGGDSSASSTDVITASSTDVLLEASSTESEIVPKEKSAQEIAAEIIREKEDGMRSSIRKEVEDEFTKGCVALDTTGYYCLKDRPNSEASLTPSRVVTSVSSLPDAGGQYKQIFMTRAGIEEQLTSAAWDSAFPAIDVSGKSVVWQGNRSGRWQIFYANVGATGTPEIVQLTHSNESNFNAKVDGRDVVWQGWVDGNWEVFLAERLVPTEYYSSTTLPEINTQLGIDTSWHVTRVTTNPGHDMFPSVAGGLVTWQSFQDNSWNVYVYSMKTGTTQKISKSGEKSEKPRFAITWDERTSEGNAHMVGYDISSGKTIDITEEARRVNDEKPYTPTAPITQPDQAALPITGAGTTTTAKSEGDGNATSTPNGLDV